MSGRAGQCASAGRGEAGSAYLIAILALVVLSLVGLAIVLLTQTEAALGGSERVTNRVFYAADSGFAVATARALVSGAYTAATFNVPDSPPGSGVVSTSQVSQTPFYPINDQPCNLCAINDAGSYGDKQYRKVNHALTINAARLSVGIIDPTGTPQQTLPKRLTKMVEFQPWRSSTDAYAAANDPKQLANIKF